MQMHGHELHLPLHLDAYLHCVYPGRKPLQVLVVLLGLREGETGVARLLCELGRLWGDCGEITGRSRGDSGEIAVRSREIMGR